jgi:hypothetical protein
MLDEPEFARVAKQYRVSTQAVKDVRARRSATLKATPTAELYRPVQQLYMRLCKKAGLEPVIVAPNHVLKHRLAAFGPPCHHCGKPLRTPAARMCAECGTRREA